MDDYDGITIRDLSDDERAMLLEIAQTLRDRPVKSLVVERSYERLARLFERIARSRDEPAA